MEKTVLLLLAVSLVNQSLCYPSIIGKVFHVSLTEPTSECNPPCHSLQYYANHSNFTDNSVFLFLEGEHHLDGMVVIRNVTNLSLVGGSSGVEIVCKSRPSGFHVEEFNMLSIRNMAISNCSGVRDTTVYLVTGSEVILDLVTISTSSGYEPKGIWSIDVAGSFSILNSVFLAAQGRNILVEYYRPSVFLFKFSNNTLSTESNSVELELVLGSDSSNVQIHITDSSFENKNKIAKGLHMKFGGLTNNSVLVNNSVFEGDLKIYTYYNTILHDGDISQCSYGFIKFISVTIHSDVFFDIKQVRGCTILVEDSTFSDLSSDEHILFSSSYNSNNRNTDTSVQAILSNVTFAKNSVQNSVFRMYHIAILFRSCFFESNTGSPIQAEGSKVIFQGINRFKSNSALVGAGIQLLQSSYLFLEPHTSILFEDNRADYVGGAIYTDYEADTQSCFFYTVDSPTFNHTSSVKISFSNNAAGFAGSALYGGGISICCISADCEEFYGIFNISNTEMDPSAIASDPYNICLCDDGRKQPKCSMNRIYRARAFPGQEFPIRLAVVGGGVGTNFGGVVPGAVRAYLDSSYNATLGLSQISQASHRAFCENFNYSVSTTEGNATFKLTPEHSFLQTITGDESSVLLVTVILEGCPLGFSLSLATGKCVCDPVINRDNIECYINDLNISRPAGSWIGFLNESSNLSVRGVLFHPDCPILYCIPQDVNITASTGDNQCESHRTGLLCGKCQDGYSLTLSNEKCAKCSNTYLILVLPLALLGLLLVVIIFALNLTVTEGSINGLIFYANVVWMNHEILLAERASYFYTFLAWLNLDLGISTCLYDGMDGLAETWLQFVFPAYLWMVILVIIQIYSKFPALANRLGGENAVKVLATLLLLSYTKLQRTVITILSFTWLKYPPDGYYRYVWLYDANVDYFKEKHFYLGIAGILVLVFLIVPYALCLTFFQQLQACSGHRLFQWVNKFKPVFDSYAGPYKDKYRFWTGMLLVVRMLLIILFTINTAGSVDVNLLITLVVSCTLLMASTNRIYKKWPYNYLESFFYLQLVLFAAGVLFARHNHGSITAVADTSIGLTLAVSLGLVGYHILRRMIVLKQHCQRLKGYADIVEEDISLITQERTAEC